jgi:hypothetical protein
MTVDARLELQRHLRTARWRLLFFALCAGIAALCLAGMLVEQHHLSRACGEVAGREQLPASPAVRGSRGATDVTIVALRLRGRTYHARATPETLRPCGSGDQVVVVYNRLLPLRCWAGYYPRTGLVYATVTLLLGAIGTVWWAVACAKRARMLRPYRKQGSVQS